MKRKMKKNGRLSIVLVMTMLSIMSFPYFLYSQDNGQDLTPEELKKQIALITGSGGLKFGYTAQQVSDIIKKDTNGGANLPVTKEKIWILSLSAEVNPNLFFGENLSDRKYSCEFNFIDNKLYLCGLSCNCGSDFQNVVAFVKRWEKYLRNIYGKPSSSDMQKKFEMQWGEKKEKSVKLWITRTNKDEFILNLSFTSWKLFGEVRDQNKPSSVEIKEQISLIKGFENFSLEKSRESVLLTLENRDKNKNAIKTKKGENVFITIIESANADMKFALDNGSNFNVTSYDFSFIDNQLYAGRLRMEVPNNNVEQGEKIFLQIASFFKNKYGMPVDIWYNYNNKYGLPSLVALPIIETITWGDLNDKYFQLSIVPIDKKYNIIVRFSNSKLYKSLYYKHDDPKFD